MAKRTSKPVVINTKSFLLPKMEFFAVDGTQGFYIRELGGKGLLEYKEFLQKIDPEGKREFSDSQAIEIMAILVSKTACDEKGNLLFSEKDIPLLSDKSPDMLMGASFLAMKISGLDYEEVAANLKNDLNSSSTDS